MEDILPDDDLNPSSPKETTETDSICDKKSTSPGPGAKVPATAEKKEDKGCNESPTKKKTRSKKGGGRSKKTDEVEENGIDELEDNKKAQPSISKNPVDPVVTSTGEAGGGATKSKKADKLDKVETAKKEKVAVSGKVNKTTTSKKSDAVNSIDVAQVPPSPLIEKARENSNSSSNSVGTTTSADVAKTPTPIQHTDFKSFFSTNMSIDDIDRQIEAKRVELARENSLNSGGAPSPRLDFCDGLPSRSSLRSSTADTAKLLSTSGNINSSSTLSLGSSGLAAKLLAGNGNNKTVSATAAPNNSTPTRKKVSIADYKKRKQANLQQQSDNIDGGNNSAKTVSNLLSASSSLATTSLPPVCLPDLPRLEPSCTNDMSSTTAAPALFEPKRTTRSNSPLYEKRSSQERRGNSSATTPQESRTTRSGSPMEKRGLSPAKGGRDRTNSPRRGGGGNLSLKHEKWESRKERDSHKGKFLTYVAKFCQFVC